jgi:hypothetical protein
VTEFAGGGDCRVLTPAFFAGAAPFQLPVFDASAPKHFCFLFSEFCLLFLRRQNPVVGDGKRMAKPAASKPGSLVFAGKTRKQEKEKDRKIRPFSLIFSELCFSRGPWP